MSGDYFQAVEGNFDGDFAAIRDAMSMIMDSLNETMNRIRQVEELEQIVSMVKLR